MHLALAVFRIDLRTCQDCTPPTNLNQCSNRSIYYVKDVIGRGRAQKIASVLRLACGLRRRNVVPDQRCLVIAREVGHEVLVMWVMLLEIVVLEPSELTTSVEECGQPQRTIQMCSFSRNSTNGRPCWENFRKSHVSLEQGNPRIICRV